MVQHPEQVIIGVDPHKLSATIEVVDQHERLLGSGRFTTDRAGYSAMRKYAGAWPERVWAVEGSNGAGRPLAQRLLEDGERVVDVPAKLAAPRPALRRRHNRKSDAHDAHAVAAVAVRAKTLRVLQLDGELDHLALSAPDVSHRSPAELPSRTGTTSRPAKERTHEQSDRSTSLHHARDTPY